MPYKTFWESFTDGRMTWKEPKQVWVGRRPEPKQVWVDPTPEEAAAEAERQAKLDALEASLLERTENLIADMRKLNL